MRTDWLLLGGGAVCLIAAAVFAVVTGTRLT